jgi:hypothetical protein
MKTVFRERARKREDVYPESGYTENPRRCALYPESGYNGGGRELRITNWLARALAPARGREAARSPGVQSPGASVPGWSDGISPIRLKSI